MENSISYWQHLLLQEEEELSPKQQKIAKLSPPKNKIDKGDFKKLRAGTKIKENQDHEVSMAQNSLDTIIEAAMELKSKLGSEEKDVPAWIQDHIAKAEDMITQASQNYHEYEQEEEHNQDDIY